MHENLVSTDGEVEFMQIRRIIRAFAGRISKVWVQMKDQTKFQISKPSRHISMGLGERHLCFL